MSNERADIFISYAHQDNMGLYEDEGWVTKFHRHLEQRLKTILGDKQLKIWRDETLTGNHFFSEEIYEQLSNNAMLVCIYSPSYLNSPWCGREIEFFSKKGNGNGAGYKVGNKSKIFKVVKVKVDQNLEPPFIREQLGYPFYDNRGIEYDVSFGGEIKYAYNARLTDLAIDLAEMLKLLTATKQEVIATPPPKKTVYVTDTPDCHEERDEVKRELEAHGYHVVPDHFIVHEGLEAYKTEMAGIIEQADFYVELLGEEYGRRFPGSEDSVIKVQHDLVTTYSEKDKKRVFVWIKEEAERGKRMKAFINSFYEQVDSMPMGSEDNLLIFDGATVSKLVFELSGYLRKLTSVAAAAPPAASSNDDLLSFTKLFLVFHPKDREIKNFLPLYKYLVSKGVEVKIPSFNADRQAAEANFAAHVADCGSVLLFYGEGDDLWLSATQKLIEDSLSTSRRRPLLGIYKTPPQTFEKEILDSPVYGIIDALQNPAPAENRSLGEFIHKIFQS